MFVYKHTKCKNFRVLFLNEQKQKEIFSNIFKADKGKQVSGLKSEILTLFYLGGGKNALPFGFFEISPKLLTKLT